MCKLMEDYGEKIRERSRLEGGHEAAKTITHNMWNSGMKDLQQIANLTKLPLDEIKELIEGKLD